MANTPEERRVKGSSGRKMPNEEIRQERELTEESKEEGKSHVNSKVEEEPYSLHLKTVSRKESLALFI
jgi:hypothetical protein